MGPDRWLDVGAKFISEVNYVLGRLYSEGNENNTKSKEYFQAQMQSDQMLIKGYIARTLSQKSNSRSLRLKRLEVKRLVSAGANSKSWYRKINSKRYLFYIW